MIDQERKMKGVEAPAERVQYPIDRYGFSEYAVVLHADPSQIAAVARLRHQIGLTRAMYEAHVTVKGTFRDIVDLAAVKAKVSGVALGHAPIRVEFAGRGWRFGDSGGEMPVRKSPQLEALHAALEAALGPLSTDAYVAEFFKPHLTLCYECGPEQLAKARQLAANLDIGDGFEAAALDLMARTGHPFQGGYCTRIQSFPLAGS